jgi:hypothetical protein
MLTGPPPKFNGTRDTVVVVLRLTLAPTANSLPPTPRTPPTPKAYASMGAVGADHPDGRAARNATPSTSASRRDTTNDHYA